MSFKKVTFYYLLFLALDFVTKFLAEYHQPSSEFLFLFYNKGLTFGIVFNNKFLFNFLLLVLPVLVVFYIVKLYIDLTKIINHKGAEVIFALILSGFSGNYIDRFSETGVVDFIKIGHLCINFADIYVNLFIAIMMYICAKNIEKVNNYKMSQLFKISGD